MASPTPGQTTNLGMAPNVGGLLCYVPCCVGLVFSVVAVIVEKQSRFVRFHAFQSLLLHGAVIVLSIGLTVLQVVLGMVAGPLGVLAWLLSVLLGLGFLVVTILLMVKAHANEEFELPVVGQMAKNWV